MHLRTEKTTPDVSVAANLLLITRNPGDADNSPGAVQHLSGTDTVQIVGIANINPGKITVRGRENIRYMRDALVALCREMKIPDEFRIDIREAGEITILDISGKMTLGIGDEDLKEVIGSLIARGRVRVIANMERLEYIDSAGLAELLRSYTRLSRKGGGLKLLNPNQRVLDLLKITGFYNSYERFESEKEALASFA
jgi:anti-sigma B factor antagonist